MTQVVAYGLTLLNNGAGPQVAPASLGGYVFITRVGQTGGRKAYRTCK